MYTVFIYWQSLTVGGGREEKWKVALKEISWLYCVLSYNHLVLCVFVRKPHLIQQVLFNHIMQKCTEAVATWLRVPILSWIKDDHCLRVHVDRSGTSRLCRWVFSCSFSRSRGQGWEGCSAEATGNCSTRHRRQHTPCGRACDRLSLAVDLLPEQGLGERPPWPGYPGQEPSQRWPGETPLREKQIDSRSVSRLNSMPCGQALKFKVHIIAWFKWPYFFKCNFAAQR